MGYKDIDRRRDYARKWIADRRKSFFENKSCVRCGSTERLELDHIDPTQKVDHKIWSWSQKRRSAELVNCQVLCHDCHLHKSINEDWPLRRGYTLGVHGLTMYKNHKCRCDVCRAANAAQVRKQRAAAAKHRVVVPFKSPAPNKHICALPETG